MSDQNKNIYEQRVQKLRDILVEQDLDALIVTHDDEYLSYELNEDGERIKFLTGFTGSAGYVVVCLPQKYEHDDKSSMVSSQNTDSEHEELKDCAVFVDGRYVVQVKEQINTDLFDDFNFVLLLP